MSDEQYVSIYQLIGGQVGVRKLVDRFYDEMENQPQAKKILAMHPDSLSSSREKLYLFLCGWFSGPSLYIQKYGHPRMRARHLPFKIDSSARDAWMNCMAVALQEKFPDEDVRQQIFAAFYRFANHMRNTPDT